jgi:FdhD protein
VKGFLYSEGVIRTREDIVAIDVETAADGEAALRVTLAASVDARAVRDRAQTVWSACGLCGRLSVDRADLLVNRSPAAEAPMISTQVIQAVPETLRAHQAVFAETGGLHAALIDAAGALQVLRRTSAGTTPWTRSSAPRSKPAGCRPRSRCSPSAAASPTKSCRRRR